MTYEKDIKGIIAKQCFSCHGSDAPTIKEFKRDEDGYKKKMKGPRYDTYANLQAFKKWVGNWMLKKEKELGKGELEAIKAPGK